MTGYTVHTGSSEKFSKGWDRIFSGAGKGKSKASTSRAKVKKSAARSKKK